MSQRARSTWAWARARSPVIQRLAPSAIAIRPSSEVASFSVTRGRPLRTRIRNPPSDRAAASAPIPSSTRIPAARSFASPAPSVRGSGSRSATTTRAGRAAISRSAQAGPRALTCAQGSSVT
jgi:hypothetical protein